MEPQLAANRSVYLVLLSRWLTKKVMILHSSSSKIAKKVWILARTLAKPSALPTILHSKGRITYLPSCSEILGAQTMLLTWTSPLIAIALQKGTSIVYPILWRRQIQLCLNTVRKVECHLSQELSNQTTEAKHKNNQHSQRAPQQHPPSDRRTPFSFKKKTNKDTRNLQGVGGGEGSQRGTAVTPACGQLSLNPMSPYRCTQSPSPLLTALCLFFFLRLPNGQYGPVSQLSRSEKCCTGPFNWGGAHCAGEKVKRKIGQFQRKSL